MGFKFKLFEAIRKANMYQRDFARIIGEPESKVSLVVNGKYNLSQTEQIKWARILGQPQEKLFGE
jgi:plasmid maintenance system antidote protein VapI